MGYGFSRTLLAKFPEPFVAGHQWRPSWLKEHGWTSQPWRPTQIMTIGLEHFSGVAFRFLAVSGNAVAGVP
jgi:hypothetical protein